MPSSMVASRIIMVIMIMIEIMIFFGLYGESALRHIPFCTLWLPLPIIGPDILISVILVGEGCLTKNLGIAGRGCVFGHWLMSISFYDLSCMMVFSIRPNSIIVHVVVMVLFLVQCPS